MVLQPICRHCVAEVQLFKRCGNLSAGHCAAGVQLFKPCCDLSASTVLQGCSCGVEISTGIVLQRCSCLRVLKTICRPCVAEVQLSKQCRNLTVGHCAAGVQLFRRWRNLSAGTVLQGCICLSGVKTYLPALCCRGAAV